MRMKTPWQGLCLQLRLLSYTVDFLRPGTSTVSLTVVFSAHMTFPGRYKALSKCWLGYEMKK